MGCPFCKINSSNPNEAVLYEDQDTVAVVSFGQKQKNMGTILVMPRVHYESIFDIPDLILSKVHVLVKQMVFAMNSVLKPDGFSIRQNNGAAGDQEIFHYHVHVIPRYAGDDFRHTSVIATSLDQRIEIGESIRKYLR